MEPDAVQQNSQEGVKQEEEEDEDDEADPAVLAKKQKQLARRGVTFEAKVDPKVLPTCQEACTCQLRQAQSYKILILTSKHCVVRSHHQLGKCVGTVQQETVKTGCNMPHSRTSQG